MVNCLIAGASGLVGQYLLEELLQDSRVGTVTAALRKPLDRENPKLRMEIVDFERVGEKDFAPSEIAFCTLGTTIKKAGSQEAFFRVDHDYTLNFARAALRSGVSTFVLCSAMGAHPRSLIFYNRVKGQTEEAVSALGFSRVIIVRPSLLLGARNEYRPAERIGQEFGRFTRPWMVGPLAKFKPVFGAEVARTMKNAGLDGRSSGVILNDAIG